MSKSILVLTCLVVASKALRPSKPWLDRQTTFEIPTFTDNEKDFAEQVAQRQPQGASSGAEDLIPNSKATAIATKFRRDVASSPVYPYCPTGDDQSKVAAAIDAVESQSRGHAFPDCYGTLQILWSSDAMGEIVAITGKPLPDSNSAFTPNMFISLDGGKTFSSPPEVNKLISRAAFSYMPLGGTNAFRVLATPKDSFTGNYFTSTNSGDTWVEVASPSSFSTQPSCASIAQGAADSLTESLNVIYISYSPVSPNQAVIMAKSSVNSSRGYCPYFIDTEKPNSIPLLLPVSEGSGGYATQVAWQATPNTSTAVIYMLNENGDLYRIDTSASSGLAGTAKVQGHSGVQAFTIINQFIFLEEAAEKDMTEFDHYQLKIGAGYGDNVTFGTARIPVDKAHTTKSFEVVVADEDEVMLQARHAAVSDIGVVQVEAKFPNGTILGLYNASRAVFSEILPTTENSKDHTQLMYNTVNPLGCNQMQPMMIGKIMVVFRGECYFTTKLQNAYEANASGLIIINYPGLSHEISMVKPDETVKTDQYTVPVVMVTRAAGCSLLGIANNVRCKYVRAVKPYSVNTTDVNVTVTLWENDVKATEQFSYLQLYTSGNRGLDFSLSLRDIRVITSGGEDYVDLYEIESMDGAYLANVNNGKGLSTVISHNKGATWQRIRDAQGGLLSLAMIADNAVYGYPGPQSVKTAPGLVIANGIPDNSTKYQQPSLHISRNGGLTWSSITPDVDQPGMYRYNILDHGSVTVFTKVATRQTRYQSALYYSLDEGATTQRLPILGLGGLSGKWKPSLDNGCTSAIDSSALNVSCEPVHRGQLNCLRNGTTVAILKDSDASLTWMQSVGEAFTSKCYTDVSNTQTAGCHEGGIQSIVWTGSSTSGKSCWVRSESEASKSIANTIGDSRATGTSVFTYWFDRNGFSAFGDWVGTRVDFSAAFAAYNNGVTKTCGDSDYENWQPGWQIGAKCDMGVKRTVNRHKQCSVCQNGVGHTVTANVTACDCNSNDYACTYGYRRINNAMASENATANETCTQDSTMTIEGISEIPTRLVPGDRCKGNGDADAATGGPAMAVGVIVVIIVVVVVVLLIGVVLFRKLKGGSSGRGGQYAVVSNDTDGNINGDDDVDEEDDEMISVDEGIAA